ncbi:BTB/POZ domain-containing protein [Rhizophagus clarus]|uniref:BTB/POZ domain-containing protein n=1 Tax=Rhizophagus clarus TaxID=94130 RepID=A0A8H3LGC1_9GLOM|nr:BTB/POZ domain-containing protein [Rhizophagus clarus]
MSLECWKEVINNYEKLLEYENGHDVIICAGGNGEIRAHSLLMAVDDLNFRPLFLQVEDYLIQNKSAFLRQNATANSDGNTAAAFHSKCDKKAATIIIIKIKYLEHIIGGYISQYWESGNGFFKPANDSFLFSFIDRNNLQTIEVGYIKEDQYQNAIYCDRNWGPVFGSHDLFQFTCYEIDSWGTKNPCSYFEIDMPENYSLNSGSKCFNAEDYEVFQVVGK